MLRLYLLILIKNRVDNFFIENIKIVDIVKIENYLPSAIFFNIVICKPNYEQ